MKKTLFVVTILGITILALGSAGFVYAQIPQPYSPDYPDGSGHMGGFGGGMMSFYSNSPMHEEMEAALASALGLTVQEIEERFEAGETLWEIASAEGLSEEQFGELMYTTHNTFLDEAVADGSLSAEQAEWMKARMGQMWSDSAEFGRFGGRCGGLDGDDYHPRWGGMSY